MKILKVMIFSLISNVSMFAIENNQSCEIFKYFVPLSEPAHFILMSVEDQRKERLDYCERVIEMMGAFGDKYGYDQRLICNTCKEETLPHGEIIGSVFLCSTNIFADQNRLNKARKLMYEAFEIFPNKGLDELVAFMSRAANELPVHCYNCDGEHWDIIEYEKSSCNTIN